MTWNVKPEMVEDFKKASTNRMLGIGPRDVDDMVRELSEKYRTCPKLRDAVDWGSSLNHWLDWRFQDVDSFGRNARQRGVLSYYPKNE